MYIKRNGKKIELTKKEIIKAYTDLIKSDYLAWAEQRFNDYNSDKKITKTIRNKFKNIANETYKLYEEDTTIRDIEYGIFSDKYSEYIEDGEM